MLQFAVNQGSRLKHKLKGDEAKLPDGVERGGACSDTANAAQLRSIPAAMCAESAGSMLRRALGR